MIIHFSKNIKLFGWANSVQGESSRRVYESLNTEYKIGVIIRPYNFERTKHIVRFQHQLYFLQKYAYMICGDLDFTKEYVDKLLLRISNLTAFI